MDKLSSVPRLNVGDVVSRFAFTKMGLTLCKKKKMWAMN